MSTRTTQVVLSPFFTCAGCGGQFVQSHVCPTMPWGSTSPGPVYIPVPQVTIYPTRLA